MTVARGGRLPQSIDAAMERLNTSVDIDSELWLEDIRGSIAHARGLGRTGIIPQAEADAINAVRSAAVDLAIGAAETVLAAKKDAEIGKSLFDKAVSEVKARLN